jgi:protein-S-isoprenylcysteine O-methyltransferase
LIQTGIRAAAVGMGIVALVAPLVLLGGVSSRGLRAGVGAEEDSGVLPAIASSAALVLVGVILWRQVPLELSERGALGLSVLGALLYFPAVGIYLWGLRSLGPAFRVSTAFAAKLPPDHEIVDRGPYRFVRHPMYLGVILAAAGALLIFRTWAMVVFFPASFVVIARARREEAALALRHDTAWEAYARRVSGWFPRLH